MSRKRRGVEIFNLSFLDVVSCGFGALILLLVISKISEPQIAQKMNVDLTDELKALNSNITAVRTESRAITTEITTRQDQVREAEQRLEEASVRLAELERGVDDENTQQRALALIEKKLEQAKQQLTEEMRRLQRQQATINVANQPVGGVPVDSEYIIFIIDTSGSMQKFAWPLVRQKMAEILATHPRVKGIQVMNDMGDYMFSQYSGRWIPDTPARRKAVLKRLASWSPFSNSSPVEGVTNAIRRFYSEDKKISLYVFGDDFSRGSIQPVVDTINRINRQDRTGSRRVRIHAIGFPVLFLHTDAENNLIRFSALMRRLAEDNNGSFVGLTKLSKVR